jgi:prevent-host-death family protein
MSTVGVRELKNHLTKFLRLTKLGEEVVVTERGKPIAVLQPIQTLKETASREAKLARMAAKGLIILPKLSFLKKVRPIKVRGVLLSESIIEERR